MHLVHRFERLPSTQDELHRLAAEGVPAGTIVVAVEQEAGRGSRGRRWESPPGGLWLSFLCRPSGAAGAGPLSLRAGLAVAEAIESATGVPRVWLKWPNDLVIADRKVGGILGEARWLGDAIGWIALGIGVNVRNPVPPDVRRPAAALATWQPTVQVDDVLWPVVEALAPLAEAGDPLTAAERRHFAERDWLRGHTLAAPVAGVADGIAADGALQVRRADGGIVHVRSGEATPAVEVVGPIRSEPDSR